MKALIEKCVKSEKKREEIESILNCWTKRGGNALITIPAIQRESELERKKVEQILDELVEVGVLRKDAVVDEGYSLAGDASKYRFLISLLAYLKG